MAGSESAVGPELRVVWQRKRLPRVLREGSAVHFGAWPGQRGFPVLESPPGKVGPARLRACGAVIARGCLATAAGTEEIESIEYGARHNGECGWGPWVSCGP